MEQNLKALKKLLEILEQQERNQEDDNIIRITKNLIHDTEDALQMIQLDSEETMFFKFIEKSQLINEDYYSEVHSSNHDNDAFLDSHGDECNNKLPIVERQNYINDQFSQSMKHYEK